MPALSRRSTCSSQAIGYDRPVFIPVLNIVIGVAVIVGGATGKMSLLGTRSPEALMAVGGVLAAVGVFQLVRAMRKPKY